MPRESSTEVNRENRLGVFLSPPSPPFSRLNRYLTQKERKTHQKIRLPDGGLKDRAYGGDNDSSISSAPGVPRAQTKNSNHFSRTFQ